MISSLILSTYNIIFRELNESLRNSYEQKRMELQDIQQAYQHTKAENKQVSHQLTYYSIQTI